MLGVLGLGEVLIRQGKGFLCISVRNLKNLVIFSLKSQPEQWGPHIWYQETLKDRFRHFLTRDGIS